MFSLLAVVSPLETENREQLYFSLLLPTDHSESDKTNGYPTREET